MRIKRDLIKKDIGEEVIRKLLELNKILDQKYLSDRSKDVRNELSCESISNN